MDEHEIFAWFELFDWALTPEEYTAFGVGVPKGAIIKDGFVVAPGYEDLAWARRRKTQWAWRKLKKARRWSRAFTCVPFVRMIAVGNALGYGNCRNEGDIDLIVITAPHRVWLVRLFIVGLLRVFRQRPGEHGRDALCPSFFLTTEAMDFESLQIEGNSNERFPRDPDFLFWLTHFTVLYDRDDTYAAFWRANEVWVRRWLPHMQPRGMHPRMGRRSQRCRLTARSSWLDTLERWARIFQEQRFPIEIRSMMNMNNHVIVNDKMIKLHTNDRRAEYRDRWLTTLRT